jgi:hypothetical protein
VSAQNVEQIVELLASVLAGNGETEAAVREGSVIFDEWRVNACSKQGTLQTGSVVLVRRREQDNRPWGFGQRQAC